MTKNLLGVLLFILSCCISLVSCERSSSSKQETGMSAVTVPQMVSFENKQAPDRLIKDMKGSSFTLSSLKGKIVVLNFWFTACMPCIQEMPELNQLQHEFSGKNVVFLAVTFDKNKSVEAFLRNHSFNYTIIPQAKEFLDSWKATVFPSNIIIDKGGMVRYHYFGYSKNLKKTLSDNINCLL